MAMLEVKNLEVYYGVIQAIKGISFEVNEGEVIALIGANGAGKTTTLQTITGMLSPAAGEIIFEGCDISKNVRQAEALCKKLAKPPKEPVEPAPRGTLPVEVEESLKQALGSEVNVAYHDGKGKLTVHFYSDEQLKAFANLLGQYQVED